MNSRAKKLRLMRGETRIHYTFKPLSEYTHELAFGAK